MFCKNCGSQVDDKAVVCPHCGIQVGSLANRAEEKEGNVIAVVGFVLSFFIAVAGLVCSIIGYKNAKSGAPYRGLALAGIVISIVEIALAILIYIVAFASMNSAMTIY